MTKIQYIEIVQSAYCSNYGDFLIQYWWAKLWLCCILLFSIYNCLYMGWLLILRTAIKLPLCFKQTYCNCAQEYAPGKTPRSFFSPPTSYSCLKFLSLLWIYLLNFSSELGNKGKAELILPPFLWAREKWLQ